MAIRGVTQFSTILDIAFTQKWDIDTLQAQLRVKEVRLNPHNYADLNEVVQMRQKRPPPKRDNTQDLKKTDIPRECWLPYPVYKAVRTDNPNYTKFFQLITSGKLTEAKAIKAELIKAYEARVHVRRSELLTDQIDVEDIL